MAKVVIDLKRKVLAVGFTMGVMLFGGTTYYSVEDQVRVLEACTATTCVGKVPGSTAIPAGEYRVVDTYSPKFKRKMLLLLDVPGFQGIRIHAAGTYYNNYTGTVNSTEGCLVLGLTGKEKTVEQTKQAIDKFNADVRALLAKGDKVYIRITNEAPIVGAKQ